MTIHDLDTPAILLDLDRVERNLRRAAEYATEHGLRLRPHTKTHKIPELAHLQQRLAPQGVTCAKLGEAEVLVASGLTDVFIAYPLVGAQKAERLARLARRARITVAVDSAEGATALSAALQAQGVTVEVLVEACTGMRRVGQPDATKVAELAERVAALPALSCAGLMCYQGHLSGPAEDWPSLAREESARVSEFIDALRRRGLPPRVVSGGSTPALFHSHLIEGLTEIRPGTYIFYDRNYLLAGACQPHDLAASALVTVVSTAVPGQIVVDGGGKTLAADRNATGADGFGMGLDDPELTVARLSEEHGVLTGPTVSRYRVGDRLRVVPNHACAMMNLHDWVYGIRGDRVEVEWVVAGRGRVQ